MLLRICSIEILMLTYLGRSVIFSKLLCENCWEKLENTAENGVSLILGVVTVQAGEFLTNLSNIT